MLPEGIVEMVFQISSRTQHTTTGISQWRTRRQSFVGGLFSQAYHLSTETPGEIFSIRFRPGGFTSFTKIPVHHLKNQMISVEDIWGVAGKDFENQIIHARDTQRRLFWAEVFLKNHFQVHANDRIQKAALELYDFHEALPIQALANKYEYSFSRFRQLFNEIVGCSPKQYLSIRRIHAAIARKNQAKSLTELAYLLGYHDQAHFIHDCKKITGYKPTDFLEKKLHLF